MCSRRWTAIPVLLAAAVGVAAPAAADLIRLRSGGEIRGTFVGSPQPGDEEVTIRSLTGARVVVEQDEIESFTRRPALVEEYESRARRTPETVDAQWELAEWCRANGLRSQREAHLERIVELDPDHEAAHRGLGHSLRDGVWTSRDEEMAGRGYVKYKGRWITPQELEILQAAEADAELEQAWFKKVRSWHSWLVSGHPERSRLALVNLQQTTQPEAVAALTRFFSNDENKALRQLYVDVLKQIEGPQSVRALVRQSLFDVDHEVRYGALNGIPQDQYAAAMPLYIRELKNDLNEIVLRAAVALQRVANEEAIPSLIDALVTSHRYRVTVPDRSQTLSIGADGSLAGGTVVLPPEIEGMLRTGQLPYGVVVNQPGLNQTLRTRTITITQQHQNAAVLEALQKLTGQNFGFDKRAWRLWHAAKKNGAGA